MLLSDLMTAIPGLDVASDNVSPDGGQYDNQGSVETMNFLCPYAQEEEAIKLILGYSKKNPDYPTTGAPLIRPQPLQHPRKPRLWAMRLSTKPWKPKDADGNWIGTDPKGLVPSAGYGPYPGYLETQLAVTFQSLPFYPLSDADLVETYAADESRRYVRWQTDLRTENIQLRQGEMKFYTTTPDVGALTLPPIRPTVSNKLYAHVLTWFFVPDNYLFNGGGSLAGGRPSRIDAALNRVNSTAFHGRPAGTLLFHDVKWTAAQAAVDAVVCGLGGLDDVPRLWDVQLHLMEFDPPTSAGYAYRGHNLGRHPTNGLYYLLTRNKLSDADADRLYPSAEFADIFKAAL